MEKNRHGYGFSSRDKEYVHERGGRSCEFPGEVCLLDNNRKVNHFEGAYVAFLDHKDKAPMTDRDLNALMLCQKHDDFLEAQQRYQVDCLMAERVRRKRSA